MNIQEFYTNIGGDYEDVLCRIPTAELVERFVLRFSDDNTYAKLSLAIESGDIEESFQAAHKLKGIVANLSFIELSKAVSDLTEQLRPCTEKADPELVQKLDVCYKKVMVEISKLGK